MEDFNSIIQGPHPVLVDVFAEWCAPCKAMAPIIKEVAHQFTGRVRVLKVDADRNVALSQRYHIQSIPTLLLFKHGKVVWRQSGAMSASQLASTVERHI